jgi:hypothetical protein
LRGQRFSRQWRASSIGFDWEIIAGLVGRFKRTGCS